jgi:hypothetical protein
MSKIVCDNIHLLQTLVDKRLLFSLHQTIVKELPKDTFTALREIFFNVAVGNIEDLQPEVTEQLATHRQVVFKIVDQNDNLSTAERKAFIGSQAVLRFLSKVLPNILKEVQQSSDGSSQ